MSFPRRRESSVVPRVSTLSAPYNWQGKISTPSMRACCYNMCYGPIAPISPPIPSEY